MPIKEKNWKPRTERVLRTLMMLWENTADFKEPINATTVSVRMKVTYPTAMKDLHLLRDTLRNYVLWDASRNTYVWIGPNPGDPRLKKLITPNPLATQGVPTIDKKKNTE